MTSGRHTFASWLIMRRVPLATVSNLLEHTSPTMTLRYAHLSPKHLTSAVRVLDQQNTSAPEYINGEDGTFIAPLTAPSCRV